jgi:hypothetical protein
LGGIGGVSNGLGVVLMLPYHGFNNSNTIGVMLNVVNWSRSGIMLLIGVLS